MPLLGALIRALFGNVVLLFIGAIKGYVGYRIAVLALLAAAYVGCVVAFTNVVSPLWSGVTLTAYGSVLGLLFPPVSGTVLATLVGLWGCVLAKRLTVKLLKAV